MCSLAIKFYTDKNAILHLQFFLKTIYVLLIPDSLKSSFDLLGLTLHTLVLIFIYVYNVLMSNLITKNKILWSYPLIDQKGRLSVWRKSFGILKKNKLNYTKELKKIRTEWDRKLPS